MAETTITPTTMSKDTAITLTQGAGTAIVDTNTMAIDYKKDGKLLIVIDSDHADTVATFAVSDFGVASGLGVQTLAVGSGVQKGIIISSDRHKQSDGDIIISWATNSAGFVRAFELP